MDNLIKLDLNNIQQNFDQCIITIGFFDGIHKVHQKILKYAKRIAIKNNLKLVIFTFEYKNKDFNIFEKDIKYKIINNLVDPDFIIEMKAIDSNYNLNPFEFMFILKNKLNVKKIVVGKNFKFGHNATGTIIEMKTFFGRDNVITININPFISSTIIRENIKFAKYHKVKYLNKFGLLARVHNIDNYYKLQIDYKLKNGIYLLETNNKKIKVQIFNNCIICNSEKNIKSCKIIKLINEIK